MTPFRLVSQFLPIFTVWLCCVASALGQVALVSVAHVNSGGLFAGVSISGNYAYLANDRDGLHVYEVSHPANPVNIFNTNAPGGIPTGVDVEGKYVYVADVADGLLIYDANDPTNLASVSSLSKTPVNFSPFNLVVTDGYAYVANGSDVDVIAVSNPAAPLFLTARTLPGLGDELAVSGDYIYVADSSQGVVIYDHASIGSPFSVGQIKIN